MDRILTQIIFKKVLWTCPKCGQEDTEDFNVAKTAVLEEQIVSMTPPPLEDM